MSGVEHRPTDVQVRLLAALDAHRRGDVPRAEAGYRGVLKAAPACFDALHLLGVSLLQRGAVAEAVDLLSRAVASDGSQATARASLVRALVANGDAAAVRASEPLVRAQPSNPEAWLLHGNALQVADAHERAVESYRRALELQPDFPAALNNLGASLRQLRRHAAALTALRRALELQPAYPMALNNLGLVFLDTQRFPEAVASFDRALAIDPGLVHALSNRCTALMSLKRFPDAAEGFARLAGMAPGFGGVLGNLLYARRNSCDWRDYDTLTRRIEASVRSGELADLPLAFICGCDAGDAQLACARTFSRLRHPAVVMSEPPRWPYRHERIRVAYLSGDFGEHAVSHLLAGVVEGHDASRIETVGVGWGRRGDGPMRERMERAFGRFIDATDASDEEIARDLRAREIDIAVDLMGHTGGQRSGIFARRCAPVQVGYLGFPGTSGAAYIDYLIADPVVAPPGEDRNFSEHLVRLPACFLPNDAGREISSAPLTRAAFSLPSSGFVFCAFNNPLKITPHLFELWLGLLGEVPAAVLWLRSGIPAVQENLRRAASGAGIDPARLVFADAAPMDMHLARQRLADLFLDTLPYNGHTTACDALWAGLPVLTCAGRSFAGRVGASLLTAVGLPELIAADPAGYRSTALALAHDPARLSALRQRLAVSRSSGPLFDTAAYCRHLEAAYAAMVSRHRAGGQPESITVPPPERGACLTGPLVPAEHSMTPR